MAKVDRMEEVISDAYAQLEEARSETDALANKNADFERRVEESESQLAEVSRCKRVSHRRET